MGHFIWHESEILRKTSLVSYSKYMSKTLAKFEEDIKVGLHSFEIRNFCLSLAQISCEFVNVSPYLLVSISGQNESNKSLSLVY